MAVDLQALLDDAAQRYGGSASGAGSGLGGLFKGGAVAEQLLVWGVLNQLLGTVLQPPLQYLQRGVNSQMQAQPLSPADLADMVNRNIVGQGDAESYAKQSGVAPSDFARLVEQAGDGISPTDAVLALRRGLIPRDGRGPDVLSLEQAVAESRIRDKWVKVVEGLGAQPLPVADAVDAVVESQISADEGAAWAQKSGVDQDVFTILYNTRGNPPSPTELLELHRRGLIPLSGTGPDATSVQQGIFEGATKNKWWSLLAALGDYVVPPRTVTAMVRAGSLTDEQALAEFKKSGLSQELAQAYLEDAHHQRLQATKDLAKGIVDQLYHDQVVSQDQATQMYEALGYSASEVPFLLAVQDLRRSVTAQQQAISRIHAQYVNHKVDKTTASNALDAVKVPSAQRDQLFADWDVELEVNVKVLTPTEIGDALKYGILDQAQATAQLIQDGYDQVGAYILLSVINHGPLPNPP